MEKWKRIALTGLFIILYISVGMVSVYHAVTFFGIANQEWLAITLACAFEIGQAVVLFALLSDKNQYKKPMPWILMGVLTIVQVIGNIFASYQYMVQNSQDQIKYFTDSVLFFVADPNPQVNTVIISYIIGAILPIVALCMTGMIVNTSGIEYEYSDPEPIVGDAPDPEPIDPKIFL